MDTDIDNTMQGKSKGNKTLFLVLKTIAVLVLIVILVGLIWSVAAPKSAGNLFYSVGLKKLSSRVTLRAANKSQQMDDYYDALIRANDAKNYDVAVYAGQMLLVYNIDGALFTAEKFEAFASAIDKELEKSDTITEQYIKSIFVYNQMRLNKGKDENDSFFKQAMEYCKGPSIYYYYNATSCPITSYINAVIDVKNDDSLNTAYNILVKMRQLDEAMISSNKQWRTNTDNTMLSISSYDTDHTYIHQDVKNLLDAKKIDITAVTEYKAQKIALGENGEQYLSAYNYWMNILSNNA